MHLEKTSGVIESLIVSTLLFTPILLWRFFSSGKLTLMVMIYVFFCFFILCAMMMNINMYFTSTHSIIKNVKDVRGQIKDENKRTK